MALRLVKVTHDRLYRDFKAYVQKEVKDGNLDLEGLELEKSLKQMERSLKNSGLDKGVPRSPKVCETWYPKRFWRIWIELRII